MTNSTKTINEAVGEIVTRNVALRVECPNCGSETNYQNRTIELLEMGK